MTTTTLTIVPDTLVAWLDARGLGSGTPALEPLGDGHSNPTFRLTRGDERWVLRRPPDGNILPSTHDVLREAAWMEALRPAGIRVPEVVATCDNPSVLGVPFIVMELLEGFVPSASLPPYADHPVGRRAIAAEFVRALAEVHAVDVELPAVAVFRRPGSFVDRQLRRFGEIWERNRTRDIPEMDAVSAWLLENRPKSSAETVVHGDARPGNAVFHAEGGTVRLVGILDWEMAAVGDPLTDVGYLLALWAESGDPEDPLLEVSELTRGEGFPTRSELAELYAEQSGRSIADLRFYQALALWKAVVLLEGNYRRWIEGQTDNSYFAKLTDGLPLVARRALALTKAF